MSDASLADLENRLQLAGLAERLAAALARAADPARALPLATEMLVSVSRRQLQSHWVERADAVLRILTTICGAAPFLAPFFVRHADWLLRLAADDLSLPRTAAAYHEGLAAYLTAVPFDMQGAVLRQFKYYELARITVRDLSPDLVPDARAGETLAELSHLADALLAQALHYAASRVAATCGAPRWSDGSAEEFALGFCVFALGKLGSEELNYSSDVDVIYAFESRPQSADGELGQLGEGSQALSPEEYFTRLAREFSRIVSETTADGFLYRIDIDLRPEGSQGALVIGTRGLVNYYEAWAAPWERAAFMKARPVAGDLRLGWRTIRAIDPIIYRSSVDYAGVAAIKAMKAKVEETKGSRGETFNVKLDAGGIRDVEFIAQALQLLHGSRVPQVHGRSTQQALESLAQVGVLPVAATAQLLAAYRFLRRVENRLQMEAERQTHRLPKQLAARERLARSMGFLDEDAVAQFDSTLEMHREHVRAMYAEFFPDSASEPILELIVRHAPQLAATAASRRMIEELAARIAREIDASPDPDRARNNLGRFIEAVGRRPFYYELLIDRPELVPRLVGMFAASEYLSAYLASYPRLIESIFSDPTVLLLNRTQLRDEYASIRDQIGLEQGGAGVEVDLAALRLFHHRALVNVALLDLSGKVGVSQAEGALTDIAEACVTLALDVARAELERRPQPPAAALNGGEFLVVGMGKLASRELTYGSDLDVIFLYDVRDADESVTVEAQEHFVRLAQKFIWVLQTRTVEGVCYEIDARLRPSGQQGMLVSSLQGFRAYHAGQAAVWERQALLRARPIAGEERLARAFEALRLQILRSPVRVDLRGDIHRMRLRIEREIAQETKSRYDLKTGRGGLVDVEFIVQYLQLQHGPGHPTLFSADRVVGHLDRLERLGLLPPDDAQTLRAGWDFLQRLSSRMRIVENRSISDLDEKRGDLDALARRLGYTSPQRQTGARRALLEDYRRHTSAIREVYGRIISDAR